MDILDVQYYGFTNKKKLEQDHIIYYNNKDFNVGYDLITGKKCDLVKAGVVDAAAIEWNVVHYSNSTCGSFLLSDGIIVNGCNNVAYDYNDRSAAEALINGQ